MKNEEAARYLANIYLVLASDNEVKRDEERLFEAISREIQAGYLERRQAMELADNQRVQTNVSARWSERIRNLEDMIFVAYSNGVLEPSEKQAIVEYARHLGIEQQQLDLVKKEVKQRHEASR
jgi:uncharacterized membrane protein YebE (DUF533 family)